MRGGGRGGDIGGLINGSIIAKDATSITVSLRQGGSKIVFYDSQSEVGKTVLGSADDLAIGKNVMVSGKTNADGSVSAQTIQIRPPFASSTPNRLGQ